MAQVSQQCQDMTAEISVSSVFDEMTTAMLSFVVMLSAMLHLVS